MSTTDTPTGPSTDPFADKLRETLEAGLASMSIHLHAAQIEKQLQFVALLHKWNRVYNLTAVRSAHEMIGRHLLDSLAVLPWLPAADESDSHQLKKPSFNILDVGTGAGLPVIPLAIARPDLQFLSVESNGKKTRFQQQVVLEVGLPNVTVEQRRIEDVSSQAHTIISRAFTAPDKFLSAVQKNCLAHSRVIIMLGVKEKLPAQLPAEFSLLDLKEVSIPGCESARHVALCEKVSTL